MVIGQTAFIYSCFVKVLFSNEMAVPSQKLEDQVRLLKSALWLAQGETNEVRTQLEDAYRYLHRLKNLSSGLRARSKEMDSNRTPCSGHSRQKRIRGPYQREDQTITVNPAGNFAHKSRGAPVVGSRRAERTDGNKRYWVAASTSVKKSSKIAVSSFGSQLSNHTL